jgi:hypothetical protein
VAQVIKLSRAAITVFTLAFGTYHGVLGLLNLDHYERPWFAVVAVSLYLVALVLVIADRPGLKLKDSKAAFGLIVAMLVSLVMPAAVNVDHVDNHSTWHVAGVATLMSIVALRQHKVMAWSGVVVMSCQVLIWGGADLLFSAGIFGALMLVAASHAASVTLASSSKAASDFREQALATTAATAAKSASRIERQLRAKMALEAALPFLNRIETLEGKLSEADKRQALGLEALLRDQIRGRHFDLPDLLTEIAKARARGVEVQVLDDGGLEQLSEDERRRILSEVATHVSSVQKGKLVMRSVADENWVVTVTASTPGADIPDLFVRI